MHDVSKASVWGNGWCEYNAAATVDPLASQHD